MSSFKKTVVFKVSPLRPDTRIITVLGAAIRNGALVAFPTETVYGLGANALDDAAMRKLCRVKERPAGKPFTLHISRTGDIRKMGCPVTGTAKALIAGFWPGPLTIILKARSGAKTGFRMPANRVALALIRAAGVPVAAPSANISGEEPPKDAGSVLKGLDGKIEFMLDAGPADIGTESTIIDLTEDPPKILRHGAISKKTIMKVIGNG
jgi:L-threonylcarbamoyladenylate synthase